MCVCVFGSDKCFRYKINCLQTERFCLQAVNCSKLETLFSEKLLDLVNMQFNPESVC